MSIIKESKEKIYQIFKEDFENKELLAIIVARRYGDVIVCVRKNILNSLEKAGYKIEKQESGKFTKIWSTLWIVTMPCKLCDYRLNCFLTTSEVCKRNHFEIYIQEIPLFIEKSEEITIDSIYNTH